MDIAAHIGQLVLEHECVIVPRLGAFLTNYHAAEIVPHQYSINPPRRNLVFNAQLNTNDGLLAHHLSQRLDISYKTSLLLLEVFVDYCLRDLADGKQIAFGELGILDRNSHNKLEFNPNTTINYNENAFGLRPLALKSIERKSDFSSQAPIQKKEVKLSSTKVITLNSSALRKIAAILIPLAVFIGTLFYLPTLVQNENIQQTSIFSFLDSLKSSMFSDEEYNNTEVLSVVDNKTIDSDIKENTTEDALVDNVDIESDIETNEFIVHEEIEIPKGQYHIICGSFMEKDRAEAFVSHLKADGFAASIAGQSKYGTYRVSMQSFSNSADAKKQIKWIRNQGYDKAWILNKTF
ncbi:MAG: SPOR domain-containing protein [Bacteroidales bacterium]|nr:SPOR domain-containing protein [Bacteroidales bacterium]